MVPTCWDHAENDVDRSQCDASCDNVLSRTHIDNRSIGYNNYNPGNDKMAHASSKVGAGPSSAVTDATPVSSPKDEAVNISCHDDNPTNAAELEANLVSRFLEDAGVLQRINVPMYRVDARVCMRSCRALRQVYLSF